MGTVSEYFGKLVFDDRVMKANLSAKVYQSLKKNFRGKMPKLVCTYLLLLTLETVDMSSFALSATSLSIIGFSRVSSPSVKNGR